jgi:hypothetical protein
MKQTVAFIENLIRVWPRLLVQVGFRTIKVKERAEFAAGIGWKNENVIPVDFEFPRLA